MSALTDTDLRIVGMRIPSGAMRGLKGELAPIDNGPIVEMDDFSLRDQTSPAGRKFEGTITSEDVHMPPVFGLWKGSILTIDFPLIIEEPVEIAQIRPAAPGSLFYIDEADAMEVPAPDAPNRGNYPEAAFRCYRPRMTMMLMEPWKLSFDEWGATVGVTMKLREV
ncbi:MULTISPECIES: hypothetical protein [Methylobacterium]|uniref:hypothetical protein n=1 Tax=Methylobacterium TaxID=407 RepID=UPI00272E43A7|nr:hypothetical protein [Methylobacterium sp.]